MGTPLASSLYVMKNNVHNSNQKRQLIHKQTAKLYFMKSEGNLQYTCFFVSMQEKNYII